MERGDVEGTPRSPHTERRGRRDGRRYCFLITFGPALLWRDVVHLERPSHAEAAAFAWAEEGTATAMPHSIEPERLRAEPVL